MNEDANRRLPEPMPNIAAIVEVSVAGEALLVLDFWFGEPTSEIYGSDRRQWFVKDDAFDQLIRKHFGSPIERALRGELERWDDDPLSALAHILLLDQFTRNAFRDTPRAFAGDARALGIASRMVGERADRVLSPFMRGFVYMPFEHSEAQAMQEESVRLWTRLVAEEPAWTDRLDYAERHRAVIERFGRFPHRNAILGRLSTEEEMTFLSGPGSSF